MALASRARRVALRRVAWRVGVGVASRRACAWRRRRARRGVASRRVAWRRRRVALACVAWRRVA
ncbi:hypothetical protein ACXZ9C_11155 [Streptococcus agalactiae]